MINAEFIAIIAVFISVILGFLGVFVMLLQLGQRFDSLRTEFKTDLKELRTEFKNDIKELRDELKNDMNTLEVKLNTLVLGLFRSYNYPSEPPQKQNDSNNN